MAHVVVTCKIMPDSPETNLDELSKSASDKISAFGGTVGKPATKQVGYLALPKFSQTTKQWQVG